MAESYEYADIEVGIDSDIITPSLLWESRHIEWNRRNSSNRIWDGMTDLEREVLLEKVRRCMEVMYDYAEEWVPESFSLNESGSVLKIELNLVVSDLSASVVERYKTTNKRKNEAAKELRKILEEDENETRNSEI